MKIKCPKCNCEYEPKPWESNEYYTPKEFVDRFGCFDYDPATTKEKKELLKQLKYKPI